MTSVLALQRTFSLFGDLRYPPRWQTRTPLSSRGSDNPERVRSCLGTKMSRKTTSVFALQRTFSLLHDFRYPPYSWSDRSIDQLWVTVHSSLRTWKSMGMISASGGFYPLRDRRRSCSIKVSVTDRPPPSLGKGNHKGARERAASGRSDALLAFLER